MTCSGSTVVSPAPPPQVKLLFVSLDKDDSGDVTIAEIVAFMNKGAEEVSNACEFAEEIIKRMDVDGDGIVDKDVRL